MVIDSKMELADFSVIELTGSRMPAPVDNKSFQPERELKLRSYEDVYLLVNTGVLYQASGAPVLGSVYMVDKAHLQKDVMDGAETLSFSGMCPVITYNAGWRNYYHNLIQAGLSTWVVGQYYRAKNPYFIFPEVNHKFVELFERCGAAGQNVSFSSKSKVFRISNASIIDTTYGSYAYAPSSFLRQYAEHLIDREKTDKKTYSHIYISRRDSGNRQMTNEREIEETLSQIGFTIICLANASLSDQIRLFADADVVVSPHGAGLANIIFCKKGTKIVELTMDSYINPCFVRISQSLGLEHYLVVAPSIKKTNNKNNSIWHVDPFELKEIINRAS